MKKLPFLLAAAAFSFFLPVSLTQAEPFLGQALASPASEQNLVSPLTGEELVSCSVEIPQEGIYDVMLDSVCGPLTYYNQNDRRWAGYLYGGQDRLDRYGCGPTVMAMLITSLTDTQVFPQDICDWAAKNNCWAPGQGSYHSLVSECANAYGLQAVSIKPASAESLVDELRSGHMLVALMRPGHFTERGHFIIITQLSDGNTFLVADCNDYNNTKRNWDPNVIFNELRINVKDGGPIWRISVP